MAGVGDPRIKRGRTGLGFEDLDGFDLASFLGADGGFDDGEAAEVFLCGVLAGGAGFDPAFQIQHAGGASPHGHVWEGLWLGDAGASADADGISLGAEGSTLAGSEIDESAFALQLPLSSPVGGGIGAHPAAAVADDDAVGEGDDGGGAGFIAEVAPFGIAALDVDAFGFAAEDHPHHIPVVDGHIGEERVIEIVVGVLAGGGIVHPLAEIEIDAGECADGFGAEELDGGDGCGVVAIVLADLHVHTGLAGDLDGLEGFIDAGGHGFLAEDVLAGAHGLDSEGHVCGGRAGDEHGIGLDGLQGLGEGAERVGAGVSQHLLGALEVGGEGLDDGGNGDLIGDGGERVALPVHPPTAQADVDKFEGHESSLGMDGAGPDSRMVIPHPPNLMCVRVTVM